MSKPTRKDQTPLTPTITAGNTITARRTFTLRDVRLYQALTVEKNPAVGQGGLAEATTYGKPVVPALLVSSLFTSLIANELPVKGAIVLGQILKFPRPVYVGETVTASIQVVSVREDRKLLQLVTQASTARGLAVDGEAVITYGPTPSAA